MGGAYFGTYTMCWEVLWEDEGWGELRRRLIRHSVIFLRRIIQFSPLPANPTNRLPRVAGASSLKRDDGRFSRHRSLELASSQPPPTTGSINEYFLAIQ